MARKRQTLLTAPLRRRQPSVLEAPKAYQAEDVSSLFAMAAPESVQALARPAPAPKPTPKAPESPTAAAEGELVERGASGPSPVSEEARADALEAEARATLARPGVSEWARWDAQNVLAITEASRRGRAWRRQLDASLRAGVRPPLDEWIMTHPSPL